MPFGDDNGNTTCNQSAEACEARIGGLLARTVAALIKCHGKQAVAAFKTANGAPTTFDEEACEQAAIGSVCSGGSVPGRGCASDSDCPGGGTCTVVNPRGFVGAAQAMQMKDATGACSCVEVNTFAFLVPAALDLENQRVFCDGTTAIDPSGDDTGTFNPADSTGFKAMLKAGTCVSKLVATWQKCHATFAKNVLKNKVDPADPGNTDEICEGDGDASNPKGAVEAFQACMTKLAAKGLPACVQVGSPNYEQILADVKTQLDLVNGALYCAP
jgi:hypothetical protein